MTRCPDDTVLQAFIAGVQSPGEAANVEAHVGGCERCQKLMDVLADVTSLGAVLVQAAARPRTDSSSLMVAMERLQLEATSLLDTPTDGRADRTLTTLLPCLAPASRDGFLGKVGGIDIRRVIGRGGMGVVFEGLDPVLNRTVAVKVLSPHLLADDDARERLLREAQAAAALAHENIVAIHDIDHTADGVPYLVLQHVAGESLADRLGRETKLRPDEVARIGAAVARGLAAAHARGLVHRDIKPANVLLENDTGRVLLTDFGLAKLVGGETITNVGTVAGTPAFMSPEQAAGEEVDARSDLFGLGSMLYAAASGRLPFAGDSPFVVLDRIRTATPKSLAALDPTLPAWLCSVVHRLLEKDPARRIPTAAEVADLLERRTAAPPNRSRRWAIVGLTAVLALTITVAAVVILRPSSPPPLSPALRETEISIAGRAERWAKLADAVAAAADGDTIVVHGDGPHTSSRIDIHGKKLTVRAADGSRPLFTPDGTTRSAQWITSDSELTLDGLVIEWPGKAGDAEPTPPSVEDGVVYASGPLTVRRCRFTCGPRMSCVASTGQASIGDCQLACDRNGGACVLWRATAALTVERTVLEGRNGVVIAGGAKAVPVELTNCVFQTDTAVMFLAIRQATAAIPTTSRRCLFDTNNVVTLYSMPAYPIGGRPTADELRAAVKRSTVWTDAENVYRRNASYATAWARNRPQAAGDIKTTADWLAFWQQPSTKSIEGDLRFAPRPDGAKAGPPTLRGIDRPSAVVPVWVIGRE
jgi:serine/threonine protein kinase